LFDHAHRDDYVAGSPGGTAGCAPQAVELVESTPRLTCKMAKARFESAYVTSSLKRQGYNVSQAAKAAGTDRKPFDFASSQKPLIRALGSNTALFSIR